jgi:very-short-patch-repair endonuclease
MPNTDIARKRLKQIFQYLEAFNQQRNPVIRQVDEQEWSLWFRRLPTHPAIRLRRQGDDSIVLSIARAALSSAPPLPRELKDWIQLGWDDCTKSLKWIEFKVSKDQAGDESKILFEDNPERVAALQQWASKREAWAGQERPAREAFRVFERVYSLYNQLEREAGRLELVLGDGLLSWRLPLGGLNHPILLQRLQLTFEPKVPEFTFQLTAQPAELYTFLLRSAAQVDPKLIAQIREECEQANFDVVNTDAITEFFKGVVTRLASGGQFLATGVRKGESDIPQISLDPVIIARPRTLGYARAIEVILSEVPTLEMADVPAALLNITGVELPAMIAEESGGPSLDGGGNEDEAILFNKPANPEQLLIAQRLDRHGCVLVQGPPGTGKTHTIANLIGHLLAQGQSVLVTSHTTKALRVLRDKVDPQLQSLCVNVLDNDSESQAQMGAAINTIAERLNEDAPTLERQADQLRRNRAELLANLKQLRTRLFEARAAEYRALSVGGEIYEPAKAARLVADGRGVDDWIPAPVAAGASLPLDEQELAELYQTNRLVSAQDEQVLAANLPDPQLLLPVPEFTALVQELAALKTTPSAPAEHWWKADATESGEVLQETLFRLKRAAAPIVEAVNDTLRLALLSDSRKSGAYRAPWEELLHKINEVVQVAGEYRALMLQYGPQASAKTPPEQQIKIIEEIIAHLAGGGNLGKLSLLFRTEWKAIISETRVEEQPPSTLEHFKALRAATHLEHLRHRLIQRWDRQLVPLGAPSAQTFGSAPEEACAQFAAQIKALLLWHERNWQPAEQALRKEGFDWDTFFQRVPLNLQANGDLFRLAEAVMNHLPPLVEARIRQLRRIQLEQRLAAFSAELRDKLATGHSPELLAELLRAVEAQNSHAYAQIAARVAELNTRHQTYLRRRELLQRLELIASGWATALKQRTGVHGGDQPPGAPLAAWRWRQLYNRLEELARESITDIQAEIERTSADLQHVTAELIETSAWAYQIRRTGLKQKQALSGWVQTMRKIGKGTGKRVPTLLAHARKLMEDCRSAVPVWIMPLARVVENYQPQRGLFDVVIIDEASQCDVMGLIALYLGKKVIVVGDHEQVSPDAVGNTIEAAQNLVNIYLQGIPNAALYDGKLSVYDLAMQSFSGTVCLREHFRCVPEIIGFSNQLAYDGKIKPLRDATHNPLSPAVLTHYVPDGSSDKKHNQAEAETVAALLVAALEQPEYADQTFGVVSLVGEEQALAIEQRLRAKLEPAEYAKHKITCGNAAQFQGDERHVMFLSVVDGPADGPLRMRQEDSFRKRFNVAASRAQNQLWVVHSLQPALDLQPGDLRRLLIEYAQNPQAQATTEREAQLSRTESEFERQVLHRLISAGYQVTPQWKVGAYRIDMVISGGGRRVALECDGDRWHQIEKIPEDMARQAILERLGWQFIRIRGSEFFRDPDKAMQDVITKLRRIGISPEGLLQIEAPVQSELAQRVIRQAEHLRMEWNNGWNGS